MYILGSGMAGCLAAVRFPQAQILEMASGPIINHRALLRMRTDDIEKLTGIEFRVAEVDKFICGNDGKFSRDFTPKQIADYSRKVSGFISKRSIGSLQREFRYIPPDNFHERLYDMVDGRIKFGQKVERVTEMTIETEGGLFDRGGMPVVSTLPMFVNLDVTGTDSDLAFTRMRSEIYVNHFHVENAELDMTVYFPDPSTNIYRASMVGSDLIIESMGELQKNENMIGYSAFGLGVMDVQHTLVNHRQENGKIVQLHDTERKNKIHEMTQSLDFYSLGRFACWRQILLDDVVYDIEQINRMINTHPYDRNL